MNKLSQKEKDALREAIALNELSSEHRVILSQILGTDDDVIKDVELFVDGAADLHSKTAGIGGVIYSEGSEIFSFAHPLLDKTNNEAEYLSMIQGIKASLDLNIRKLNIFSDSELIVKQINGEYKLKNPRMFALNQTVFTYLNQLELWSVSHVRRELNVRADELSKIGMQEAKNSKK
jgi:ribonuclease HI